MKKVLGVIGFYVALFSILFSIGYFAPYIVFGFTAGMILVGLSKCVKMAYLGLRSRLIKK